MARRNVLLLCALTLLAGTLSAQGLLTDRGFNGMGATSAVYLAAGGYRGASVSAGYSISGILDLGLHIGVAPGVLEGSPSTDLEVSCLFDLIALKQSATFPLSLQLTSAYGLVTTDSRYLDLNHLTRRAFRYGFGVGLYSSIYFTRAVGIQVGAVGSYAVKRTTTEPMGTGVPGYPRSERRQTLELGGDLGVLFRTTTDTVYRVGVRVLVDQGLTVSIAPALTVSARGM